MAAAALVAATGIQRSLPFVQAATARCDRGSGLGRRRAARPGPAGPPGGHWARVLAEHRARDDSRCRWTRLRGKNCVSGSCARTSRPTDACQRRDWPHGRHRCGRSIVVERAQAVQRPERVDRAAGSADRVDRASTTSSISAGTTSVLPRSTSSRWACIRQNMLSFSSAATSPSRIGRGQVERLAQAAALSLIDPVDPAVRLVAQRRLVGVPLAGLEARAASGCAGRCSCTSRSPRRCRRARPRPGSARSTRRRWPAGSSRRSVTKSLPLRSSVTCAPGGRSARRRRRCGSSTRRGMAGGVQGMAGRGREAAVKVDLADLSVIGCMFWWSAMLGVPLAEPAADRLVIAVGDRHVRRGSPLAVEQKITPVSLKPTPHELLLVAAGTRASSRRA